MVIGEAKSIGSAAPYEGIAERLGSAGFLDDFAFAYHLAVAERLRGDARPMVNAARANLRRWIDNQTEESDVPAVLSEWDAILSESKPEELIELITSRSDEGQRLRSSSPFAGTLPTELRRRILSDCEQRATA
jgi:hypothetical protein